MENLENNTEVDGGGINKLNKLQHNESNITKVKSGSTPNTNTVVATTELNDEELAKTELRKVNNHRHSNESGI